MAERLSALFQLSPSGPEAQKGVSLSEVRPLAILQVQAWPDTLSTVDAVLAQTLGVESPPDVGRATWFHNGSICAIGAGRYLVSTTDPDIVESLRTGFSSEDAALTDISHGRTVLRLEGEAAAEILSRCAPLDFDFNAFPADRIAQTAIHHMDVLIHRLTGTSFEIWVLRSFAHSLAEWIIDAGMEMGVGLERSAPGG